MSGDIRSKTSKCLGLSVDVISDTLPNLNKRLNELLSKENTSSNEIKSLIDGLGTLVDSNTKIYRATSEDEQRQSIHQSHISYTIKGIGME